MGNIKKDRIRSYFLDAAKEIVSSEGAEGITVRKVAERSGYSYATIYNYYQDLNALLWDVKIALTNDLRDFMKNAQKSFSNPDIKAIFHVYVSYYIENPNIFRFLYLYPLSGEQEKQTEMFSFFDSISLETQADIAKTSIENTQTVAKTCVYAVHGMLLLYFSANGMTKESLFNDLSEFLKYMFEKKSVSEIA